MSQTSSGAVERKNQVDSVTDRLILDIKAFMLLALPNKEFIAKIMEDRIASSQDSQVSEFARILKETGRKEANANALIFTALGEMILASIMTILGIAILAPSIGGLNSPSQLFSYFSKIFQSAAVSQSSLSPVAPALELILSLLLLLGAFYTLRMAADTLREGKLFGSG